MGRRRADHRGVHRPDRCRALADGPYETAAGYLLHRLGRLADVGDTVMVDEHELTVAEVDGHRITRISVREPGY